VLENGYFTPIGCNFWQLRRALFLVKLTMTERTFRQQRGAASFMGRCCGVSGPVFDIETGAVRSGCPDQFARTHRAVGKTA